MMRYGILFPAVMSVAFGSFFFYAANLAEVSREEVWRLGQSLGFQIVPEYRVLQVLLRISGFLLIVIGIALGLLVAFLPYGIPIPAIVGPRF